MVNKMLNSQIADNTHPALPPVMEVEEADEGILAPVVPPVGDVTLTKKRDKRYQIMFVLNKF